MKLSFIKLGMSVFLIFALSACTQDNGRYAVLSTRQVSPYSLTQTNLVTARNVTASDSRHVLILLPSDRQPSISDPINELLKKYHGNYLSNASVTHKAFNLMWLYHYDAWEVTADVMQTR